MSAVKPPPLNEANLLDLAPLRTARWEEVEGRVVVERPRPRERGLKGVLAYVSHLTGVPRLRLDELGGFVWRRLDGAATVGEICEAMRRELGETCEPAEERVRMFLGVLRREGIIAYPGYDDEAVAHWRQQEAG